MNCEAVRELAGAYALRALSPEEMREVDAHLAECNLHDEMAALRATATVLAYAAAEREPPVALRSRIMAAVAEPDRRAVAPVPVPIPIRTREGRGSGVSWALAAALGVVALASLFLNITLIDDDTPPRVTERVVTVTVESSLVTFTKTVPTGPGAGTRLSYIASQQLGFVDIVGLGPLDEGRVYQLWTLRGKDVTGVGTFVVGEGGTLRVPFWSPLNEGDVIAVTEEPKGGSELPTTEPIFTIEVEPRA